MMFTDLPRDLESEILSRVPAASLKQLQTTCKRWYALCKDPRFVKKNFGKAATQVILADYRGYSVTVMDTLMHSVNLHGIQNSFDPSIEVAGKLNKLKDSKHLNLSRILIHCEGLLLCNTSDMKLVVWNPCTGQTRWIQSDHNMFYKYVLGYENNGRSCNRYKVLTFDSLTSSIIQRPPKFEISLFSSDSWRILDDVSPNFFIDSDGVTLKGNAYWFASDEENRLIKFILQFDFTTERFGRLRLPLPFQSDTDDHVVLSVFREEKLALLQWKPDIVSLKMKIWVTKTNIGEAKDLSWSNFLVVDFGKVMLPSVMIHFMSFLVDEENKMVVCCGTEIDDDVRTKFYFAKEGIRVHQESAQEPMRNWPYLVSYVPSLVHIH